MDLPLEDNNKLVAPDNQTFREWKYKPVIQNAIWISQVFLDHQQSRKNNETINYVLVK